MVVIPCNNVSWQLDRTKCSCGMLWGGASWPTSLIPFLSYCHSKWRMMKDSQRVWPKQPMSWIFRMSLIMEPMTNDFLIIHAMSFVEATWNMPFTCLCALGTLLDSKSGSLQDKPVNSGGKHHHVSSYSLRFIHVYGSIRFCHKLCHHEPSARTSNI